MDNIIYLIEADGTWMAHFAGPHAADIEELFDTTTLPTAFTAKIAYEFVAAQIRENWPHVLVAQEAA